MLSDLGTLPLSAHPLKLKIESRRERRVEPTGERAWPTDRQQINETLKKLHRGIVISLKKEDNSVTFYKHR